MEAIDLAAKLALLPAPWQPRIVAELNGQHVKLAKILGDFVWHRHEGEDELFLVLDGRFRMDFRDRQVWVERGQMIVVPRGVEHKPYAAEECALLLFESAGTLNTGDVRNERTVAEPGRI